VTNYLIIGGSVGAVGAVEAIRETDPAGDITIVSDEANVAYSRPMISDYLSGEADVEKMVFPEKGFWEKYNAKVHLGKKAVKLDLSQKAVELDDGERIGFDKLLIATGGKPFIPKMDGIGRKGVFCFTNLAETESIRKAIAGARKAVVIGGGLIGISVADALAKRSLKVTVVELKGWVLNLILDRDAAKIVETSMQREGVSIITGHTVKCIQGKNGDDSTVGGVVLDDGVAMECDMVVVAIGVTPRTELTSQTAVKVNRGILVDRCMQTSVPGVYACGDVAEAYDFIQKSDRVLALWSVARMGGRTAGSNMAGHRSDYPGATAMSALNYFGIPVISVGLTTLDKAEGGYETLISGDPASGIYKKIILKDGIIVGMTFVGEVEGAGTIFNLIRKQVKVDGFKDKLLTGNFSLASLPKTLRSNHFEA
jgi:NAD(P)H-nitrite reductase large subunit